MSKRVFLCLLLSMVASCDLISVERSNGTIFGTEAGFEESLREYNAQATETFDAARVMLEATEAFAESGEGGTISDESIDGFTSSITAYRDEVAELDLRHTEVTDAAHGQALIPAIVGGSIVVWGLSEFADWLDEKRERVEELKDVKGQGLADGDAAVVEAADDELNSIGEEVIQEIGTRVTTELLTAGIDTSTVRGVLFKDKTGKRIQRTIKVMSATNACEAGFQAADCRIGFDETDDGEALVAGPGEATALLIDEDNARIAVQVTVEPAPGDATETEVDPLPIDGATPDDVASNDTANGTGGEVPANNTSNNTANNMTNNVSTGGDRDGDGTPDDMDNCPDDPNWFQIDTDGDGIGNECDEDACPAFDLDEDGCVEGMEWSRNVAACVQPTCPTGARHNADMFCCCNCWDDKTTVNVSDPCRTGFLLFCGEPPPEDGG